MQFKVSSYFDNRRAQDFADMGGPYFRFRLHHNHGTCTQHNLLKDLSDTFPHDVFYVAPLFYEYADYQVFAATYTVFSHTAMIGIDALRSFTDAASHYVLYNHRLQVRERSESRDVGTAVTGEELLRELEQHFGVNDTRREVDARSLRRTTQYLEKIHGALLQILHQNGIVAIGQPEPLDMFRGHGPELEMLGNMRRNVQLGALINDLARRFFGAVWIGLG